MLPVPLLSAAVTPSWVSVTPARDRPTPLAQGHAQVLISRRGSARNLPCFVTSRRPGCRSNSMPTPPFAHVPPLLVENLRAYAPETSDLV